MLRATCFFEGGMQWSQNASASFRGSQRQMSFNNKLKTSSYHRFFVVHGPEISSMTVMCTWPFKVASELEKNWNDVMALQWQRKEPQLVKLGFWCSGSCRLEDGRWGKISHIHVSMIVAILCRKTVKGNNCNVSVAVQWQTKHLQGVKCVLKVAK